MDESQNKVKDDNNIVIDGTNLIAGRLSSHVAKLLLQGKKVAVVNCENILISGKKQAIITEYKKFLKIASILQPKHGPFHPRRSDRIIIKMIKGMLPNKKPSGKNALSNLRTYIGFPKNIKSINRLELKNVKINKPTTYYIKMSELSTNIG